MTVDRRFQHTLSRFPYPEWRMKYTAAATAAAAASRQFTYFWIFLSILAAANCSLRMCFAF
jgi:hypothetical protein